MMTAMNPYMPMNRYIMSPYYNPYGAPSTAHGEQAHDDAVRFVPIPDGSSDLRSLWHAGQQR